MCVGSFGGIVLLQFHSPSVSFCSFFLQLSKEKPEECLSLLMKHRDAWLRQSTSAPIPPLFVDALEVPASVSVCLSPFCRLSVELAVPLFFFSSFSVPSSLASLPLSLSLFSRSGEKARSDTLYLSLYVPVRTLSYLAQLFISSACISVCIPMQLRMQVRVEGCVSCSCCVWQAFC